MKLTLLKIYPGNTAELKPGKVVWARRSPTGAIDVLIKLKEPKRSKPRKLETERVEPNPYPTR
jgi:hypothetical protein